MPINKEFKDFRKAFAQKLRGERRRLHQSQTELAVTGGVSLSSQVGYEAGARVPDAEYLHRIMAAGIDVNFLLGERPQDEAARAMRDVELGYQVLEGIDQWAESEGMAIPLAKKIELARMLYPRFYGQREFDKEAFQETLRRSA